MTPKQFWKLRSHMIRYLRWSDQKCMAALVERMKLDMPMEERRELQSMMEYFWQTLINTPTFEYSDKVEFNMGPGTINRHY